MKKILIVGCGLSGATLARLIADNTAHHVHIIDKKSHVAGHCHDYKDENGITIHAYGSHIFHTEHEKVWNFIRQFTDFNQYMHKVVALVDGIETTIPFNIQSLHKVLPASLAQRLEEKLLQRFSYNSKIPILEFLEQDDEDLKFLAHYVYEKVFLQYTAKQWGLTPKGIDSAVTARVPLYISQDCRYFQDKYQGIPLQGYTQTVENMLDHERIETVLNCDFSTVKHIQDHYEHIFYTGSIDTYFDHELGILPYRSLCFALEKHEREHWQSNAVVNYPCNYDFTRIHEYKYYLQEKSPCTVIAKEYSLAYELGKNEPFYPIAQQENLALYTAYAAKAAQLKHIHFLGRLGDYSYYDMDQAILRAMQLFEEVFDYTEPAL